MSRTMKDSGINWIGAIPIEWKILRFKDLIISSNGGEVIEKSFWNSGEELLYTCQKTPMKSDYPCFPQNKRTRQGDILLTRNASPYIFIPEENSIYSNVVQRVKLKDTCNLKYIKEAELLGALSLIVNGDTIPSYNMETWKNIFIPFPSRIEQDGISEFLDEKCSIIDIIIKKTKDSINEYMKMKQAVITRAVTKGIRGDREYKNSETDWMGNVPKEWTYYRIANLYTERKEQGREDLPILQVSIHSGITDHEISDEEADRVFVRSEDRTKYQRVYPGDLAYNMMRAWQGAFGAVRVEGMISPAYVAVKPIDSTILDSRYMEALFRTPMGIEEMHRFSYGVADFRLRLYWQKFRDIKVCIPSKEEQIEIADFIDDESKKYDEIISKKKDFICEIEKYKKSMIFEYVTGKKEVIN